MSKRLDIDERVELWLPALNAVKKNEQPICPICNSCITDIQKKLNKDNIGYLLMTCDNCGKSGYFSRVLFK